MTKYPDGIYKARHNHGKVVRTVEIVGGKLRVIAPEQGVHWFHPEFFFEVNHIVDHKITEK